MSPPSSPAQQRALDQAHRLYRQGRFGDAERLCREALKLDRHHPDALYLLGLLAARAGKSGAALRLIEAALLQTPEDMARRFELARLLDMCDNKAAALTHYEIILKTNPDHQDALFAAACLHQGAGRNDKAQSYLEGLVATDPYHLRGQHLLMQHLLHKGDFDAALNHLDAALQHNPNWAAGWFDYAEIKEKTHNLNAARQAVQRGLEIAPHAPHGLRVAATIARRHGNLSEAKRRLDAINLEDQTPPSIAEAVAYEQMRLADHANDPDTAFAACITANRLAKDRFAAAAIDRHAHQTLLAALEATPPRRRRRKTIPSITPPPIFLVGFPRSGTTLLDQALDAHPAIITLEEEPLIGTLTEDIIIHDPEGYPAALAQLSPQRIATLRSLYQQARADALTRNQRNRNKTPTILIDKLPLNILHLSLIDLIFPDASLIVALRHPLDVCLSCLMQSFQPNAAMANFLTLEDTIDFYRRTMTLWLDRRPQLGLRQHALHYETLVDDFRATIGRLLDFIGIAWDDAVLDHAAHAKNRGTIRTPSYDQVSMPLYRHAVYRWDRYREHLAPAMDSLSNLCLRLGYADPNTIHATIPPQPIAAK